MGAERSWDVLKPHKAYLPRAFDPDHAFSAGLKPSRANFLNRIRGLRPKYRNLDLTGNPPFSLFVNTLATNTV
jgi:hypothetical protein